MIYVIGPKGSSVVKIGFTGGKPSKRLTEIQIGNPAALAVLWTGAGDRALEDKLHTSFRPFHLRGEWYDFRGLDPSEEVQAAISSIGRGLVPVVPASQLPNCVCGHRRSKHGADGCIVAGYQEWEDCQCTIYASSTLLEGVAPITLVPTSRDETWGIPSGERPDRQHRWYDAVHREIEGMRWPGDAPMVPGYWPDHLTDMVIWRVLGCEDSSRYPGAVLDEIVRLKWAHAGPMVPGGYAEDLTDRIVARLV